MNLETEKRLKEGLVVLSQTSDEVFYNPAQVVNRDLSIIAIKSFAEICKREIEAKAASAQERKNNELLSKQQQGFAGQEAEQLELSYNVTFEGFNILEPLAASGLRSIRYAKELSEIVRHVHANDIDPSATDAIKKNCILNDVSSKQITVKCKEGCALMYEIAIRQHNLPTLERRLEALNPPGSRVCLRSSNSQNSKKCVPPTDVSSPDFPQPTSLLGAEPAEDGDITNFHKIPKVSASSILHDFDEDSSDMLFDVVDIDPYGSVSQFLDSAIQAVRPGGMLCVTSTDMPVLCGVNPEVSFYKYGGLSSKAGYMHEMSLRLIMNALTMSAAKYKRVVIPLACFSVDFYVRLFVRVKKNPSGCKEIPQKTSLVYQCSRCCSFHVAPLGTSIESSPSGLSASKCSDNAQTQVVNEGGTPASKGSDNAQTQVVNEGRFKYRAASVPSCLGSNCSECGSHFNFAGPIYSGPLYSLEFIKEALKVCDTAEVDFPGLRMTKRIKGLLTAIEEELFDVPLHYSLPMLLNHVKLTMVKPSKFKTALRNLGYQVSHFHRHAQSIKTNAPNSVVFDIVRAHAKEHPPKKKKDGGSILMKEITVDAPIDFDGRQCNEVVGDFVSKKRPAKWVPNPEPFWGPKSKARKLRSSGES